MLQRVRRLLSARSFPQVLTQRLSSGSAQSFWYEPEFAASVSSFVQSASFAEIQECLRTCVAHGSATSDFLADLRLERFVASLEISDLCALLLRLASLRQPLTADLLETLEIAVAEKFPISNLQQFASLVIGCSQLSVRRPEIFSEISSWLEKHENLFETHPHLVPSVLLGLATLGVPGQSPAFAFLLPHLAIGNLSLGNFVDVAVAAATADLPQLALLEAIGNKMLEISREEISDHAAIELAWLAVILGHKQAAGSLAPKLQEFFPEIPEYMQCQLRIDRDEDPGLLESEIFSDDAEISGDVISDLVRLLQANSEDEAEICRKFYVSALPANEIGIFCHVDERTFPDLPEPIEPYLRLKRRQILEDDRKFLYVNAHVWRSLGTDEEKLQYIEENITSSWKFLR